MTKYSQNFEQEHILGACKDIVNGKFLDIGAYHPTIFSNTRALYENGWGGVMVEAGPDQIIALAKEYGNDPRITLFNFAVGQLPEETNPHVGMVKLNITADAVSTTHAGQHELWKKDGGYYGAIWVQQVNVPALIQLCSFSKVMQAPVLGKTPQKFDFINIDVEGGSAYIFLQLLQMPADMLPKCFCVEYDHRREELKVAAAKIGYEEIYWCGENSVFVKK